mgnify:CR=1 FL=1|tara:strand:+ start:699 stop:1373 length:675 start_codon:yes stop_codon:yes gene_type:complete
MSNSLIKINNLNKKFKNFNNIFFILNNLNLEIKNSQIVSIVGPSGVGKTTLLNIIGLLDSFNGGEYYFNDLDVNKLSIHDKNKFRNENIGFVHQFFHLIPELTVIENVALPKMIKGENKNNAFMEAENLLNIFGLNFRKDFKPTYLSGGEQQRVSIARALINKPKLIIADEMTGNLDEKTANEIFYFFINEIKKNDQTAIFATHNNKYAQKADIKLTLSEKKIL